MLENLSLSGGELPENPLSLATLSISDFEVTLNFRDGAAISTRLMWSFKVREAAKMVRPGVRKHHRLYDIFEAFITDELSDRGVEEIRIFEDATERALKMVIRGPENAHLYFTLSPAQNFASLPV
ncbi:MAG: hypothetical protein ACRD1R_00515 [Acidobacteriota bacterium]